MAHASSPARTARGGGPAPHLRGLTRLGDSSPTSPAAFSIWPAWSERVLSKRFVPATGVGARWQSERVGGSETRPDKQTVSRTEGLGDPLSCLVSAAPGLLPPLHILSPTATAAVLCRDSPLGTR